MKTIFMVLVLAAGQDAQRADCTALVAAQGAIVTLEKAPAPAPSPKPASDGVRVGGPIDMYRDARALIDKGNTLADRGKTLLDQAQRDGKITVDIRLPAPSAAQTTPPASIPQTPSQPGGDCPGGVCPSRPPTAQAAPPSATAPPAQANGEACRLRRPWRSRR